MSSDLMVWVKYGKGSPVRMKVPVNCIVCDLIKAIKAELTVVLKDYDVSQIELRKKNEEHKEGAEHKDGEESAYEPDALVSTILSTGVGASTRNPILISTIALTAIAGSYIFYFFLIDLHSFFLLLLDSHPSMAALTGN